MTDFSAAPSPAPLRVLLVDDDTFMLALLTDMLADLGIDAVRAEADARTALASLAADPPDLLICDLSMPDMDGIEFMQAAAGARYGGSVMLLSGMDEGVRRAAETLARAQGLKVLGAFKKPISVLDMSAALVPLFAAQATA